MIDECPIYWLDPTALGTPDNPAPSDPIVCDNSCHCGYVQFENLLSYLDEIKDSLQEDAEKGVEFEFKLRQEIVAISRMFDKAAGVEPGYFSKAHYTTTKIFPSNGTKFIKVPTFVKGTMEVRTSDDFLLDASSYGYQDGFLVYMPCAAHQSTGCCYNGCGNPKPRRPVKWPASCYKITARWGLECADPAVEMAVRDYLIERNRVQDPIVSEINGIPISRGFKVPHSWGSYLADFKAQRRLYSQFAFA